MTHHVIIGGGPAATNAIETIRQFDGGQSKITMICDEPAHSRMALPYWLSGNIEREHTHTGDDQYFQQLGVDAKIGTRVARVDPQQNAVVLTDGSTVAFDNLLIATGSSPLDPPIPGKDLPGVQPLWSLAHTQSVLDAAVGIERPRVVMIGAGFIGFIMLNAMFKRGWDLTVVEREPQVLPRMLDREAAGFVERWLETRNVKVHTGATVQEIRGNDDGSKSVELDNGQSVPADLVIIATGVQPNLDLVDGSGIETDHGILVNDRLQTNFSNIYAAGDVAQGKVLFQDDRQVHAIQPTAVDHGRVAGANMAGQDVAYPGSLLMNVVDVCGLQCASFGKWHDDADTMTISNHAGKVFRKLVWSGDQLVGAIFVGRANDVGMLTDVGMVKGILQTQTPLEKWKDFLRENPFDIRRPYIAVGVAKKLAETTLVGRPTQPRKYRFAGAQPATPVTPAHAVYVDTKRETA